MKFSTILVANRGEIARRIFKTCRRLGYQTVAVYSEADRLAPFVREADRAYYIGESPATSSYLCIDKLLEAAKATGADAIHPGYGFLSENPEFVQRVVEAGITFIGPTAHSMRIMGDKAQARQFMSKAGVLVTPGYDGADQSNDKLIAEALEIGLPVMVKAAAGGGGKGMSIVHDASQLSDAIEQARRLAQNAFGSEILIIEKYIENPRHLEVQVLGDQHGNVLHVFERECSVQRRFQKVVEEAPAPNLSSKTQAQLHEAAIAAARQVDYVGAGTVEFIADQAENFYFLEMNTRLQVEHPVSECITGLDLVEWQIRVASGETLPEQSTISCTGHAIEVRLYAEDPANEYLPSIGRISAYEEPQMQGVRFDSGVELGSEVSIYYDPMLSKVIATGDDREQARRRLINALQRHVLSGLCTNRMFLLDVLAHDAFIRGTVDTGLLGRDFAQWSPQSTLASTKEALVALIVMRSLNRRDEANSLNLTPGWRLVKNEPIVDEWLLRSGEVFKTSYRWSSRSDVEVCIDESITQVCVLSQDAETIRLEWHTGDGARFQECFKVIPADDGFVVLSSRSQCSFTEQLRFPPVIMDEDSSGCVAPMPGKIVRLLVGSGDAVEIGTPLVVLEAMKMEQTLEASGVGIVEGIHVQEGDLVAANDTLVEINYDET